MIADVDLVLRERGPGALVVHRLVGRWRRGAVQREEMQRAATETLQAYAAASCTMSSRTTSR